jgi:TonB family protein
MLALLPAVFSTFAVAAVPTVTPAEAAQHVGKEVIVEGTIDQITTTVNLTTHINFGGRYPNHLFTATILKASQKFFAGIKQGFEGRRAQVQGVVRLYRGKPEIMITQPSQLRLAEGAPSAAAPAPAEPGSAALGELRFDAKDIDFSAWTEHFKAAVVSHWDRASASGRGTAEFEFVVERDGSMSAIRLLQSSGTTSLDRAAANALERSRFLPLPEGYPEPSVMMRVGFVYGAE